VGQEERRRSRAIPQYVQRLGVPPLNRLEPFDGGPEHDGPGPGQKVALLPVSLECGQQDE
jgi:hypothetical protein